MQAVISRLRRSASLKAASIGFLTLLLLIPLGMIEGVIYDRGAIGDEARSDIMRTWGGAQVVGGPVLVIPYERARDARRGEETSERLFAYALPAELTMQAAVDTELRYRGMHKVPVYSADIRIRGAFDVPDVAALDNRVTAVHWDDAFLAVVVSDARAITSTPEVAVRGATVRFRPGHAVIGGLQAPIVAPTGPLLNPSLNMTPLAFDLALSVNGTETLEFLPFGDSTQLTLESDWASPSFVGSYLPESRNIGDSGFDADYRVSSIGRALPSRWTDDTRAGLDAGRSAFGVDLYMPVSLYQLTLRAAKYGVLFVALTFVAYFLFETVAALRLHPLQYLLVGLANSLFFLLLLSLAEHIGFGAAYLASALGSIGLIVGYSYSILRTRRRAAVMAAILACLYTFLYLTLQAENYALLAGSIGLWTGLALTMYLTRRIDWYGDDGSAETE